MYSGPTDGVCHTTFLCTILKQTDLSLDIIASMRTLIMSVKVEVSCGGDKWDRCCDVDVAVVIDVC